MTGFGLFLLCAPPTAAQDRLPWTFAACAGRYSAEKEHAWLFGTSDAAQHESNHAAFVSLTEATLTPISSAELLHHRIIVKFAHAQLLTQTDFQADRERALIAQRLAASHITTCQKLLLGG